MQLAQALRVEPREAGAARLDRRADPLQHASRRSHSSATPAGSGATSRSAGQRASASPSRSPARTPYVSAAAEASPISCSRPASGASATGPAASASRPPAATASSKRGIGRRRSRRTHVRTPVATARTDVQPDFRCVAVQAEVERGDPLSFSPHHARSRPRPSPARPGRGGCRRHPPHHAGGHRHLGNLHGRPALPDRLRRQLGERRRRGGQSRPGPTPSRSRSSPRPSTTASPGSRRRCSRARPALPATCSRSRTAAPSATSPCAETRR